MSVIRPLEREDLPWVAVLYERVMRSGGGSPPPGLAPYFERTFLDHPWADPELPSLVYEDRGGHILGFMGSHARRLRFDGRPIRMRCGGQMVSDPSARRAPGALLMRNFLGGPQELTITDGATDDVRRMWEGLGGRTAYLSSLSWTRVFRPAAFVGGRLATRSSSARPRRLEPPLWRLMDAPVSRLPALARTPQPAARGEPLTPEGLLAHLEAVADGRRIRPDYDLDFLRWLFDELPRVETRGELVRMLVRAGDRVLGWYVAYLRPHDSSAVLQIAARARDVGTVIDHLFRHARERGAAALQGRWEPHLFAPLWRRGCIIRHDARALVHSRDPELLGALTAGDALLTRMEGEWWMGHHIEPFDRGGP